MNRSKARRIKQELRQLVEAKRQRDALNKPCPECGQVPARWIWVDHETGLEDGTREAPCARCRAIQDRYRPEAFNVIQFYPVDPDMDPDRDPVEEGPDAA